MPCSSRGVSRRRASSVPSRLAALFLCIAALCPAPAVAEIRTFNGPIAASSNYVHFSEGFILAPGYVDLSQLTFAVTDDGGSGYAPAPRGRDDDEPQPAEEPTANTTPPPSTDAPVAVPAKDTPAPASAVPTAAPVQTTSVPTAAPAKGTAAPVQATSVPTAAPAKGKAAPVPATSVPTAAPAKGKAAPVPATSVPTAAPAKGKAAPVQATSIPTAAPAKATAAPVQATSIPTAAPVKATAAPVQATAAPVTVAPTAASVAKTEAPVATPKDGEDSDGGGGRSLASYSELRIQDDSSAIKASREHRILEENAVELEEEAMGDDYIPPTSGASVVDIVFFLQPAECSQSQKGCDWTKLGVGASDDGGNLRWCCTEDAAELGFCDYERQAGRLIVDKATFAGEHRFVTVPPDGDFSGNVLGGDKFTVKDISGKYVMVIANCDDMGRDVNVSGTYSWVSKHGYLPGELFGEMYFFAIITVVYFLVFVWYALAMHCNRDSTIGIQKWILWTIFLGLLETFFNAGNYFVWNEDGVRVWFAMYSGVVLGVMKRAISRCLVVMVSLGWGVVRDTLGDQLKKIVFLGILYVGVSAACECMKIFAIDQYKTLSLNQEEELFDVVTILTFVVAAIDVTFYMWILDALNGTMQYLENMSQSTKLRQYLRLRCILLLSILFAVVWAIFGIVNSYMDGMLEEQQQWAIQAAWELNYLMVLIGVSSLWRPNKYANEYAYVMELPSMASDSDDVEFETNADTISDEDGYDNVADGGLKVDNAVDA